MSTQTILAGIGYAVGSYFGYPQLGLIVGSLVGAALTPAEKTEGPKIDDQKVTVSTYGAGIPTVYGTVRIGGNVVDSTDKIELPFTDSQGGKGGGVENTSYRYFVHMRHVLCATPTDGSEVAIRKIWKDGKLIYDASFGISVGSALASAESPYSFLILYQGHEDQMPDGIEELYHGVGNVPAYRGVVSVRLNIIECPGGRVPQFSFELTVNPASVVTSQELTTVPATEPAAANVVGVIRKNEIWHVVENGSDTLGTRSVSIYQCGQGYASRTVGASWPFPHTGHPTIPCSGDGPACAVRMRLTGSYANPIIIERIDMESGAISSILEYVPGTENNTLGEGTDCSASYNATQNRYAMRGGNSVGTRVKTVTMFTPGGVGVVSPILPGVTGAVYMGNTHAYALNADSGTINLIVLDPETAAVINTITGPATYIAALAWSALDSDGGNNVYAWYREDDAGANKHYIVLKFDVVAGTWEQLCATANTNVASKLGNRATTIYCDDSILILGPSEEFDMKHYYSLIRFKAISVQSASAGSIISEQCIRAGMGADEFDVSAIDDEVWGYTLTNPASARSNIQPLLLAFAIDATEEDSKIKFFHRASLTSIANIAYQDLACVEDKGEPGDPMPLTRAQEAELPRSTSVSYINKDFDYQTGTEKAIRQVTQSVMDMTLDLPISVDSDVAATLAQRALYDAWNDRNRRSFTVKRKFAYMSAGNVVTIEYPEGTLGEWRLAKLTDTGVMIEGECVPANAAIYSQTAVGGASYSGQTVEPLDPPTRLQLLDIPLLRDEDNNAGIYAAMDSYGDVPASAELLVGDDDNTLMPRGTVSGSAPIGFAETALGSWTGIVVDEKNLVTVDLGDDVFNSVTRDVLLANGGEFWALGAPGRWEIGCSALGSSLGNGRYILSRHLRGLFGTERFTGAHQVGDTIVLLRIIGILRPNMGVGDVGSTKSYRAITKGRSQDSAASQTYINTAEGLMSLSPINLRRTNTNDLTVDRRSRLSMNNSTGTLPLGETTEAWSWAFYNSSFTALLGTVVSNTATVTAAQMTAAGITPTATLYVRVAQLSDSVGKGHELQATA